MRLRIVVSVRPLFQPCNPQIDLAHLKAGQFDAEIKTEQRQLPELLRQEPVVPGADLGQPVIGDHKGPRLGPGQVIEAERRNLVPAELASGKQPAMTGDEVAFAVDQDRNIEAERSDAGRDLLDLPFGVEPRIGRIGLELLDAAIDHGKRFGSSHAGEPSRAI